MILNFFHKGGVIGKPPLPSPSRLLCDSCVENTEGNCKGCQEKADGLFKGNTFRAVAAVAGSCPCQIKLASFFVEVELF